MLEFNLWLLIASFSAIGMQGIQLGRLSANWPLPVAGTIVMIVSVVVAATYFASDFIASQSLLHWQEIANQQWQTIQIIVLLELALACFLTLKVLPFSTVAGIAYLQLQLFQQGWLNLPFAWQGAVFGCAIACFFVLNYIFTKVEKSWPTVIFIMLLVATYLTAVKHSTSALAPTNWYEMLLSLSCLTGVILLGVVVQKIKISRTN